MSTRLMHTPQIRWMIADGESETVEFKETTGERNEAAKSLCAMLNHRGGTVLIGVKPDGAVSGQQVSDATLQRLTAEIRIIDPQASPTIEQHPVDAVNKVIAITVSRGESRPYTYKGDAYRRIGNTTRKLSLDEYNQMLLERIHSTQRWESEPAAGWTVADLDEVEIITTVNEAIRQNRLQDPGTRDIKALLTGLGLIQEGKLLRAAIVLFGKRERNRGHDAGMPVASGTLSRYGEE